MKKYFLFVFAFTLFALTTPVFAETKLDPKIYDKKGFRLDQKLPDFSSNPRMSTTTSTTSKPILPTLPKPNLEAFKQGELASCFDYYTFGSVKVNLTTDTGKYEPGDTVMIRGQIKNDNRYPLTNLTVRARLVKNIPNPEYFRSEIITLEDFNIAENITLEAGKGLDVKYSHLLPLNSPKGEYQILFYAYNNDRFNQSGLSFTNDIVASRLNFSVEGKNIQQIYLDQTKITLNDKPHNVMAFMTNHEKNKDVNISIPLVNPSDIAEGMTVTYTLYKWDGLRKENIVDTKKENVEVPAKGRINLNYLAGASKIDSSVYFLNITADNTRLKKDKSVYDIKTESNIRFTVSGYDFPRINSFGVDAYPIKANTEATLFTCYHNGASQDTLNPINISTILYDDKDNIITQTEYKGKMGGDIKAIVKKFNSKKDIANFKIVTTLSDDNGKVIDTIENKYKCEDIDKTFCPIEKNNFWLYVISALVAIVILILVTLSMKKKKNVIAVLFLLAFSLLQMGLSANKAEAAVRVAPFYTEFGRENEYGNIQMFSGNFYKTVNLTKNGVSLSDSGTNTINSGETINIETPSTSGDWFMNGQTSDSPPMDGYGYNWNVPYSGVYMDQAGNASWFAGVGIPMEFGTVQINSSNPSVVSCNLNQCTAVGSGTTTVTVSFPDVAMDILTEFNPPEYIYYEGWGTYHNDYYQSSVTSVMGFGKVYVGSSVGFENEANWNIDTEYPFSFSPITYTITVPPVANTPQVSSCASITNVSATGATINWAYTDADNDLQTQYQVQLATKAFNDPSFSELNDIALSASGANNNTSHSFTGLTTGTTYYARVRTTNSANGESNFSSCADSFKPGENSSITVSTDNKTETSIDILWEYNITDPVQDNYKVELATDENFTDIKQTKVGKTIANNPNLIDKIITFLTKGNFLARIVNAQTSVQDTRTVKFAGLTPGGTYWVRVSVNDGSSWSTPVRITFTMLSNSSSSLSATCIPNSFNVPVGGSLIYTVTSSNASGTVSYKWKNGGVDIPGETSNTYSPSTNATTTYDGIVVVVSDNVKAETVACVRADIGGGVNGAPCPAHDNIILKDGQTYKFWENRISKECNGEIARCVNGALKDSTGTSDFDSTKFRYQKCAEPVPVEF